MAKKNKLETKQMDNRYIRKRKGKGGIKGRISRIKGINKYRRTNMPTVPCNARVKKLKGKKLVWKTRGLNSPTITDRLRVKKGKNVKRNQLSIKRSGRGSQHKIKEFVLYTIFSCIHAKIIDKSKGKFMYVRSKILDKNNVLELLKTFLNVAKTGIYEKYA
jgi:hypothetical protein